MLLFLGLISFEVHHAASVPWPLYKLMRHQFAVAWCCLGAFSFKPGFSWDVRNASCSIVRHQGPQSQESEVPTCKIPTDSQSPTDSPTDSHIHSVLATLSSAPSHFTTFIRIPHVLPVAAAKLDSAKVYQPAASVWRAQRINPLSGEFTVRPLVWQPGAMSICRSLWLYLSIRGIDLPLIL